jgi:hypothetical protein
MFRRLLLVSFVAVAGCQAASPNVAPAVNVAATAVNDVAISNAVAVVSDQILKAKR